LKFYHMQTLKGGDKPRPYAIFYLLCFAVTAFFPAMATASKTIQEKDAAAFSQGVFDRALTYDGRIYCANGWSAFNGNLGPLTNCRAANDGEKIILFGGQSSTSPVIRHNETYSFDTPSGAWQEIAVTTAPSARTTFGMADDGSGKIVLSGGYTGQSALDDTWIFLENDWAHVECSTHPSARMGAAMAHISTNTIILFGGKNGAVSYSDTWLFNTSASSWTLLNPPLSPSARSNHAMSFCGEGKVMLYGGEIGGNYKDDCWIYDISSHVWTEIDVSALNPGQRSALAMTYDSGIERVLLFGGETQVLTDYSYNKALWMFNPVSEEWAKTAVFNTEEEKPEGRRQHILCHSPGYGNLLFGGGTRNTNYTSDEIFSDFKKYVMHSSGTYTTKIYDTGVSANPAEYKNFWRFFGGTGDIKCQVATSSDPENLIYTGPTGTGSYYTSSPQALESSRDGERYFSVRIFLSGIPENVPGFYLSEMNLKYNHIPVTPVLYGKIVQNGDSVSDSQKPRFYWFNAADPDDDEHTYELRLSTDSNFSVYTSSLGIIEQEGTGYSEYQTADFYPEGEYYWKVRATDDYGYSGFSDAWNFFVDTTAPAAVTDLSAEKILDSPGSVRLSWTASGDNGLTGDINGGEIRIKWLKWIPLTVWTHAGASEKVISTSVSPGERISTVIDGLSDGTSYYFAAAYKDEVITSDKNLGKMSNNDAFAWTDSQPEILSVDSPVQYEIIFGTSEISYTPYDIDKPDDELSFAVYLSTDAMASWITLSVNLPDGTTFFFFDTLSFPNSDFCNIRITASDKAGLSCEKISDVFIIRNPNYSPSVNFTSHAEGDEVAGEEVWAVWEISDANPTDTHLSTLSISSDSLNWNIIAANSAGNSAAFNSKLLKDGIYHLKVEVADSQTPSASDEKTIQITIANGNSPPAEFSLIAPPAGAILSDEDISFSWGAASDPDGDAVTYTLMYSTKSDFSLYKSSETPDTHISFNVTNMQNYYWKVNAVDLRGMETESSETFLCSVYRGSMTVVRCSPHASSYGVNMTSVTLYFNNPVNQLSVSNISVKEDTSEVLPQRIEYAITGENNNVLVIKCNFLYPKEINISIAGVEDTGGIAVRGETGFSWKNFMPAHHAATVEFPEDNISVVFSTASFSEPCYVGIKKDYSTGAPQRNIMEMTRAAKFVNDYGWFVEMTGMAGTVITPDEALTLSVGYNNSLSRISASNIFAVVYVSDKWQKASDLSADGTISFPVLAEGPYSLAALRESSSAAPALVNKPNPLRNTTEIWADNPGSTSVIVEVFALTGEKVYGKTYPFPAAGFVRWDGKDNAGFKLPDGMYELSVTASGKTMRKLMGIVR